MRYLLVVFFLLNISALCAQVDSIPPPVQSDSLPKDSLPSKRRFNSKKIEEKEKVEITIKDYKIISQSGDTTFLDTTLTIQKEYKYNVLRRDDFELMPFANVGQPYNNLGRSFNQASILPNIGARARYIHYLESDAIRYFHVPTPTTELFFKTVFEQGQFLDALLTLNTSERLNFSIAYNGFRSLGKYQYEQSEHGRFRFTFNYRTENDRYWLKGHFAAQDMEAEENGGLSDKEEQFESGEEEFLDRSRLDVFFSGDNNTLARQNVVGRRYFLEQQYNLVRPKKDSATNRKTRLGIRHSFQYESKYFQFTQQTVPTNSIFGDTFFTPIDDKANLKVFENNLAVVFSNPTFGTITGDALLFNYDYYFNSLLIQDEGSVTNRLTGDEVLIGGTYANQIGPLKVHGNLKYGLLGDLTGNLFTANAEYRLFDDNFLYASIHGSSRMPNFNFLLYQSDYQNFNWQNNDQFEKQQVQSIKVGARFKWLGDISAKFTAIDNYTFFDSRPTEEQLETYPERAYVRPYQEQATINYLRVKWNNEVNWRKWALNNTVLYQQVEQENEVLNVPKLLTRNTLYFSSHVFKKAMFLQTGVTFKYFTSYNMDAYNSLLGEFYVQDQEELGAYPLIDFFINAKVRQTRIYLKAEHLNTLWSQNYDYYAAPNRPYRDFVIRFGLVWNLFS